MKNNEEDEEWIRFRSYFHGVADDLKANWQTTKQSSLADIANTKT